MSGVISSLAEYLWGQSWQLIPVFLLVAVLCRALGRASAHWRYLLWGIVLLKCAAPAVFPLPLPEFQGIAQRFAQAAQPKVESFQHSVIPGIASASRSGHAEPASSSPIRTGLNTGELFVLVWAVGTGIFLVGVGMKGWRIQRELKRSRTLPNMELECEFLELAKTLGVGRRPRLHLIRGISQPFVWGTLRGSIYLPEDFPHQGTARQRRLVIAHELAHVLRWDALMNLVQVGVQALFWFHPLVWLVNARLRREREKCCDEAAIASLGADSREYGGAIVDRLAAYYEPASPSSSLALSGRAKELEERIKNILQPNRTFVRRPTPAAVVSVFLLALFLVPARLTTKGAAAGRDTLARADAPETVDLGRFYNARISDSWLRSGGQDNLRDLPGGLHRLGRVPFDIGGVMQLAGGQSNAAARRFPSAIKGIPVRRAFERLYLLDGTSGVESDGSLVAKLVIHYADGKRREVPIRYGAQVRNWWFWKFERVHDSSSAMVWTGDNPSARADGASLRLYRTIWKNPRPGMPVERLDYVSGGSKSAPFLVALTIEPVQRPATGSQ